MKLTRRKFVQHLAIGSTLLSDGVRATAIASSNIIFILADDLGWGDLSCYGRPDYRTPNIDSLALQGTKFTDAYSASAVCTPTRCAYITGRYPARFKIGLEEPLVATNSKVGLEPNQQTIASLLKQSGYDTALIGKWHLGFRPEWGPKPIPRTPYIELSRQETQPVLPNTGSACWRCSQSDFNTLEPANFV